MKTDDLIDRLSQESPRKVLRPIVVILLAVTFSCALAILVSLALWGGRLDLDRLTRLGDHGFLVKLIFAVSIIVSAVFVVVDLSVPGRKQRIPAGLMLVPFVFMALAAIHELSSFSFESWPHHAGHASWTTCLQQIVLLAIPAFALLTLAVRKLAPTNLRRAGFFIGLVSGAVGVLAYILHAEGESLSFSVWAHSAAVLIVAVVGTIFGPRLLRWT